MGRRVNFMLDDDSWRVIERLLRGMRSRAVQRGNPRVVACFREAGRRRPDGRAAREVARRRDRRNRPVETGRAGATAAVIVTPDASVLLKSVIRSDDEQDTDAAVAPHDQAVTGTLDLVVPHFWRPRGQHAWSMPCGSTKSVTSPQVAGSCQV